MAEADRCNMKKLKVYLEFLAKNRQGKKVKMGGTIALNKAMVLKQIKKIWSSDPHYKHYRMVKVLE
jgi:hypothetical protein